MLQISSNNSCKMNNARPNVWNETSRNYRNVPVRIRDQVAALQHHMSSYLKYKRGRFSAKVVALASYTRGHGMGHQSRLRSYLMLRTVRKASLKWTMRSTNLASFGIQTFYRFWQCTGDRHRFRLCWKSSPVVPSSSCCTPSSPSALHLVWPRQWLLR